MTASKNRRSGDPIIEIHQGEMSTDRFDSDQRLINDLTHEVSSTTGDVVAMNRDNAERLLEVIANHTRIISRYEDFLENIKGLLEYDVTDDQTDESIDAAILDSVADYISQFSEAKEKFDNLSQYFFNTKQALGKAANGQIVTLKS